MSDASPSAVATPSTPRSRIVRCVRWCIRWMWRVVKFVVLALVIAWGGLALHYSNLPWPEGRTLMAVLFIALGVTALWLVRQPRWRWAFAAAFALVVIWYILIPASNDRPWRPEVSRLPEAIIAGDRVRLLNVRNFEYRTPDEFDVRYEEREVDVSRLVSVDLFISYWKLGPVAHTFLSFNFDDGSLPVCISIETRPEVGQGFDPLASLFKQFELIYVVGDERDLVRVRTNCRHEEVYLYDLRASPRAAKALFRAYLDRINSLAKQPEWYHLLSNSCTINAIRHSRSIGGPHRRFELRHYLNGLIDAYLYQLGMIDTTLPFEELRSRSNINDEARAADDAVDFSARIRAGVPDVHEPDSSD